MLFGRGTGFEFLIVFDMIFSYYENVFSLFLYWFIGRGTDSLGEFRMGFDRLSYVVLFEFFLF